MPSHPSPLFAACSACMLSYRVKMMKILYSLKRLLYYCEQHQKGFYYTKNNIAVISHRANSIKNDATPEELQKIADWVRGEKHVRGL